ncbi:MAG: tetratricopeptide repeat protein [Pirellulales bacterium]
METSIEKRTNLIARIVPFMLCIGCILPILGCQLAASNSNAAGVQAVESGQPMAALNHFNKALAHNPTNADAYYNLASTYHEMGKKEGDATKLQQAESLYNSCLDISPDHVDCHRGLAVLLVDTKRSDKAYTLLERWSTQSPQLADPKIELARLYEEFGEKQNAMTQLNQALVLDANNSRAWSAMGHLREESGDLPQALANYQRSYQLNNFDNGVGTKIASLQRQGIQTTAPLSPGGDTRFAQNPNTTRRY